MIAKLLLFGATGDLAGRLLLPGLAALRATGRLPEDFLVLGTARDELEDAAFRRHVAARLQEHVADVPAEHREGIVRATRYRQADLTDAAALASLIGATGDGAIAAYLALPPALFASTLTALQAAGLPPGSRLVVEKPFGERLEDAVALNELIARVIGDAGEQAVFGVDHVLGMATVQNLLALRRQDPVLGAVWDADHVERVEVRWEEDLALEGRAGYYDGVGALKDVLQNHMLQVLCITAMEPRADPGERALRNAKVDVLRAIRPLGGDDIVRRTRRARYGAGASASGPSQPTSKSRASTRSARRRRSPKSCWSSTRHAGAGRRFVLRAGKALRASRKGGRAPLPPGRERRRAGGGRAAHRHRRPLRHRPAPHRDGADDPGRPAARDRATALRPRAPGRARGWQRPVGSR